MNMNFVTKLVLIPIEEWEKVKKAFTSKEYFKYCGSGSRSSDEEGGNSSRQWDQTNGSEKEEETIFESYGSEEEECNFNN